MMEADPEWLSIDAGFVHTADAPAVGVTGAEVCRVAFMEPHRLPPGEEPGLEATRFYDPITGTFAAGAQAAVVEVDAETGFVAVSQGAYSAFRVAEAPGERSQIRVRQTTLDTVMEERNVGSVDLLKVDVEGAELLVLQGGERCLTQAPRPLLLCEFNDVRAAPYGHTGSQVYAWLHDRGYAWFSLPGGATLKAETEGRAYRYTNLLACPPEKRDRIAAMMSA